MQRVRSSIITFFISGLVAFPAFALNSVTVLGDKSMNMAIVKIAREYSASKNVVVNTSFVSPEQQEAQILEGGAADILITPRVEWIEELKLQGLLDIYSQMELAKNRLVFIGPMDSAIAPNLTIGFPTASIIRAIGWEQGFMVGNPQYMADGAYAKDALRNMNASEDLEQYTLYIKRPDQIAGMVRGRGAYGVFFQSTVRDMEGVKVLDVLPEELHQPMQYYAVVIAGNNMDEARKFMDYLRSKESRRLLINNGYVVN
ncbi:MAG: molybdate ABC transporter substrate-binding protein [Alphaproteobacteria bacterium]